jgi:tetratricopeptide (TPR) repeat protein
VAQHSKPTEAIERSGLATDPAALFDLGNTLFEGGETEAAILAFRCCLAAAPNNSGTCYNLANALLRAGHPVEAVECFLACLQLAPGFGSAYINLAEALRGLGLLEQAQWAAELGVQHLPDSPEAKICLANTLHDRSEYTAAVTIYQQALDGAPDNPGALTSLGNTLHAMGHLAEAVTVHDHAVVGAPNDPDFHFNLATTLLAAGDFARGWKEYEWRWQRPRARLRGFGVAWCGETITGRTILLHAEQGLGDTLQFVRYVPMVAARGARVVLEVQPPLVKLMRTLPGVAEVVAHGDALPRFDTHCPLLSLPYVFRTSLQTIPAEIPYLHADPLAVAAWRMKLPVDNCLRIGLVWAGSPHSDDAGAHLIDRRRSLALADLASLDGLSDVHLVSLQKQAEDSNPTAPNGFALIDPMADVTDFADTAALVANLDLVISVDTSVAHLAGGLGKRVWLLSRYDGCWRWLHGRDDSPWYPAMRIYRQHRPNDWSGVLARIRRDLEIFVAEGRRDGDLFGGQTRPLINRGTS